MSHKIKELVALAIVIIIAVYAYGQYRTDQNQSFPINGHSLELSFYRNVTQVNDLNMDVDYVNKAFTFKTNFIPSTPNVVFGVEALQFNQKNRCDIQLQELDSEGTPKKLWVVDNKPLTHISMENNPKNTTLLLKGTCFLNDTIPNGYLQAEISNQTKPVPIGNVTLSLSFDDSKFGCRENCLYNDQMHIADEDSNYVTHNVIMKGKNIIDARNLQFSLRTFNKEKANSENLWLVFLMGLIFLAFQIAYDLYREFKFSNIISKFKKHEN